MTDARKLWTQGSTAPATVDTADIVARGEAFHRKMTRGVLGENLAGLFVIAFFGYDAVFALSRSTTLTRIGSGLIVAGCIFLLVYLNVRGRPEAPRSDSSSLAWYRAELERWRKLHRTIVRWYLGPLMPGMTLFLAGMTPHTGGRLGAWIVLGLVTLVVMVAFSVIARRNLVRAIALDAELAALPPEDAADALRGSTPKP